MIYNEIKHIKFVEKYVGVTTIYSIQSMPIDTSNDKMTIVLRLLKLINGMSYQGNFIKAEVQKPINMNKYNQDVSTALSYANRDHFVVGSLVGMFIELLGELNTRLPNKPNYKLLKELVDKQYATGEKQDFEQFFNNNLTEEEKIVVDKKVMDNNITGQSDLDWKVSSFVLKSKDGDIVIQDRQQFISLKNEVVIPAIQAELEKGLHSKEIEYIFSNISKVAGNTRRYVYSGILQALLFRQDYDKYNGLIKAKNTIDGKTSN